MKQEAETAKYHRWALWLSIITIAYNLVEGIVSTWFGVSDDTLVLFGFGLDSFVETVSALGVLVMVRRIQRNPHSDKSRFEITALRITGASFYALSAILLVTAGLRIWSGDQPESTLSGIIISSLSILTMWLLVRVKKHTGRKLNSQPIISDANCNLVCMYMSVVVLVASLAWEWLHIPYVDALGALGLVWFSVKEGREAFAKAKGIECCGC